MRETLVSSAVDLLSKSPLLKKWEEFRERLLETHPRDASWGRLKYLGKGSMVGFVISVLDRKQNFHEST